MASLKFTGANHIVISSLNRDQPTQSAFNFTMSHRGLDQIKGIRIAPVALTGCLSIPNVNIRNNTITFSVTGFAGTYSGNMTVGYYSVANFLTALTNVMNTAAPVGVTFNIVYNTILQNATVTVVGAASFRFESCSMITKSQTFIDVPYGNAYAATQTIGALELIYTPTIYIKINELCASSENVSFSANDMLDHFTSFPKLDPVGKRFDLANLTSINSNEYIIYDKRPINSFHVILVDVFGENLEFYCPYRATDFIIITICIGS